MLFSSTQKGLRDTVSASWDSYSRPKTGQEQVDMLAERTGQGMTLDIKQGSVWLARSTTHRSTFSSL